MAPRPAAAPSPSVFDHTDYRVFLRAWVDASPRRSVRGLAMRAGCSYSMLQAIVKAQRRLAEDAVDALVRALRLPPEQGAHFRLLVLFAEARTAEARSEAWQEIIATRHFRAAWPVTADWYEVIARWDVAATLELARCRGFQPDPAWIATRLDPPVAPEDAARALALLVRLGLLVPGPEGSLLPGHENLATGHQVNDQALGMALLALNRWALGRAGAALDIPASRRHFEVTWLSVPASFMPVLKREIGRFHERILGLATEASEAAPPERVLVVAVQAFPVASSPDGDLPG